MATKYASALRKIKRRIERKGVVVEYGQNEAEIRGQAINRDNRVESKYFIYVMFLDEDQGDDGGEFTPRAEAEALMSGDVPFIPQAGDWLKTPAGKVYPIDNVNTLEPDGVPIRYRLRLRDG